MSKEEMANSRCTVAEFAERWYGIESATALMGRSGVTLAEGKDGETTFRYGDLVEWTESNSEQFHRWLEEFDPTLKRTASVETTVEDLALVSE